MPDADSRPFAPVVDTLKIDWACTCGSAVKAELTPDVYDAVAALFEMQHTRRGHQPTDGASARRIRALHRRPSFTAQLCIFDGDTPPDDSTIARIRDEEGDHAANYARAEQLAETGRHNNANPDLRDEERRLDRHADRLWAEERARDALAAIENKIAAENHSEKMSAAGEGVSANAG